jgi:hypothetical protein
VSIMNRARTGLSPDTAAGWRSRLVPAPPLYDPPDQGFYRGARWNRTTDLSIISARRRYWCVLAGTGWRSMLEAGTSWNGSELGGTRDRRAMHADGAGPVRARRSPGPGTLVSMSDALAADRKATLAEVEAHAKSLRDEAAQLGLSPLQVRDDGTLVIHSDDPGYKTANRLSAIASQMVGAYVHVITDDVPGAAAAQLL